MNHISLFVGLCSLLQLISASSDPNSNIERPLIFNPFTLSIYDWPNSKDGIIQDANVAACPASSENEKRFNLEQSMDSKALFVRMHDFDHENNRYTIPMCDKKFKLAVAFHSSSTSKYIEFGFEIYSDKQYLPPSAHKSPYQDFGPVTYAQPKSTEPITVFEARRSYPYFLISDEFEQDLDFIWIPKMRLEFNVSLWKPINIKYAMHRNTAKDLGVKCADHNLGSDFYDKNFQHFEDNYSSDNQKNIFNLVKLPNLPEESECKSKLECVKKYDLVLPYLFQAQPSEPASCSNLTTIPLWYEMTEKLLHNVDKFLIALSQITLHRLVIIAGTYDILSFPNINDESESISMYLNPDDKKIPIPKIIYKIVLYKPYTCDPQEELCLFYVIIVIHNEPKIAKEDRLCPQDKCEQWGWGKIQYTKVNEKEVQWQNIYCCKFDAKIRNKLKYHLTDAYYEDLNLKWFPFYNNKVASKKVDAIDKNFYLNKQNQLEDQLEKLEAEIRADSSSLVS